MQLKPIPGFFQQLFPEVIYVIDYIDTGNLINNPNKISGKKPIVMKCMSCGGILHIDGSKRIIDCEFCNSTNYLPDELWLSIHEIPVKKEWFLIFKLNLENDNKES